MYAIALLR